MFEFKEYKENTISRVSPLCQSVGCEEKYTVLIDVTITNSASERRALCAKHYEILCDELELKIRVDKLLIDKSDD